MQHLINHPLSLSYKWWQKTYQQFDVNLLLLNVQKILSSYIFPHKQKLPYCEKALNIQGLHIPAGWLVCSFPWGSSRWKPIFQVAYWVSGIKGLSRSWNYSEAEASLSFLYPSYIILLSYLPLFMLRLVSVDVYIFFFTYTFT